jgi:hypothetical protein
MPGEELEGRRFSANTKFSSEELTGKARVVVEVEKSFGYNFL